jgi:hypothetical protein
MKIDRQKKPSGTTQQQRDKKNILTKNNTIMGILYERPLNRFQAEEEGDHCLPSTISRLSRLHGLEFPRKWVKVPNRFGGETSVKEYSTSDEDKLKINKILGVLNG